MIMTGSRSQSGDAPVPDLLWLACDGVMVIDEHRRVVAINPTLERWTGRQSSDVAGQMECGALMACRNAQGCPLADQPASCPGVRAMQKMAPIEHAEYTIRAPSGTRRAISASYTPIHLPDHPLWTLVVMRDVTRERRRERWLARQAKTDALTGLPNRTAFVDACAVELKRAVRHHRAFAIAMADLDGFKAYNDTYGHGMGDVLLQALAQALQAARRGSDLVARYGGDEFVLLLPETNAVGAQVAADRLRELIARFPFARIHPMAQPPGQPLTISIGLAVFPEDGETTEVLLFRADERLYAAKRQGRDRVVGPESHP